MSDVCTDPDCAHCAVDWHDIVEQSLAEERARDNALQAMHDLIVWTWCQGRSEPLAAAYEMGDDPPLPLSGARVAAAMKNVLSIPENVAVLESLSKR